MKQDDRKLLEAIERLVSDDLCEDLEYRVALKRVTTIDGIRAIHRLGEIYKLLHSRLPHPCHSVHESWRRTTENLLKLS